MSEKYKEYCMKFSNEEIRAYMVDYLISNSMDNKLIKYLSEDGDEIQFNTSEKIGTIVFDGDDENLFINFYGIHTSIFVDDTEIMFIDENQFLQKSRPEWMILKKRSKKCSSKGKLHLMMKFILRISDIKHLYRKLYEVYI